MTKILSISHTRVDKGVTKMLLKLSLETEVWFHPSVHPFVSISLALYPGTTSRVYRPN